MNYLNDYDLDLLPVNEAYKTVVQVASGNLPLDDLTDWIRDRMKPLRSRTWCSSTSARAKAPSQVEPSNETSATI